MYKTAILGTGSYLPQKILTNEDLEKLVDTSDQWIVERTGIKNRHIADVGENTSDLCLIAAQRALEASGLTAQDIDLILVATSTGDQVMPNTSSVLQQKLGCGPVGCLDLNAACSGFVYALTVADKFIKSGANERILVVGAEIISRFLNYKDRETCILFGDGAGAVIVGRADNQSDQGIHFTKLRAEGNLADLFVFPGGGSAVPFTQESLESGAHYIRMKGREIFKNAVRTMSGLCQEAMTSRGLTKNDISWVVPHQANGRIMDAVASQLEIETSKVVSIVHEMGNTSAASVPVALDMAVRDGRIQRGQKVLLTAFGAGLTAGAILLTY